MRLRARKATGDIVVYKCYKRYEDAFDGGKMYIKSPCMGDLYKYHEDMMVKGSFTNLWNAIRFHVTKMGYEEKTSIDFKIGDGFIHSFRSKMEAMRVSRKHISWCVYKCVIPKGTYYYTDGTQYASRKLIVGKWISKYEQLSIL